MGPNFWSLACTWALKYSKAVIPEKPKDYLKSTYQIGCYKLVWQSMSVWFLDGDLQLLLWSVSLKALAKGNMKRLGIYCYYLWVRESEGHKNRVRLDYLKVYFSLNNSLILWCWFVLCVLRMCRSQCVPSVTHLSQCRREKSQILWLEPI